MVILWIEMWLLGCLGVTFFLFANAGIENEVFIRPGTSMELIRSRSCVHQVDGAEFEKAAEDSVSRFVLESIMSVTGLIWAMDFSQSVRRRCTR